MKKDPEIAALEAVHTALKPLDATARARVLISIYSLLEIPSANLPSTPTIQSSQSVGRRPTESVARTTGSRPMSLVELMQEKKPVTNSQKIALFAYYREMHEGQPRFARGDLEAYFGVAKEKPSANYGRDFVEAVKKGWVHESGSESYITSKGVEAVEAGFPAEPTGHKSERTPVTKTRKNPKPKRK